MLLAGWRMRGAFEQWQWQGDLYVGRGVATGSGVTVGDPEKQVDVSLLWNVWRLLQRSYVDPQALQTQQMLDGAVEGMVAGVGDPFTAYMPPAQNVEFRQTLEGTLEGIGAELNLVDGAVVIVSPLKNSPAERAGLLPGDIIAEVDKQKLDGLSLNDVVSRIRGKEGTRVTLQIYRGTNPQPLLFTITRASVTVPSVEEKILTWSGSQVGYVALNQFGDRSMQEVRDALTQIKAKPVKGIILDLRGNGGGYLDGAVDLASMFIKKGAVVTVKSRIEGDKESDVTGNPVFPDIPMAVLINQASASASEIVAGALQDNGRATIVGMKSYGKGTVQEVIEVPGGGSLRVTVARWYTPKGKNLSKEGVTPDVVVERAPDDAYGKKDTQLDVAVRTVLKK